METKYEQRPDRSEANAVYSSVVDIQHEYHSNDIAIAHIANANADWSI